MVCRIQRGLWDQQTLIKQASCTTFRLYSSDGRLWQYDHRSLWGFNISVKITGSFLLVFVGVTPHQHHTIVEAAYRHDVTLLCLSSQTAHEMQLVDQSVFGPFLNH